VFKNNIKNIKTLLFNIISTLFDQSHAINEFIRVIQKALKAHFIMFAP
jgi:hypothetical protein